MNQINLGEIIREAEQVQRGAGVSEFTRMYRKMLKTLRVLSTKIEVYAGAMVDE